MKNVQKDTQKPLEVVTPTVETPKASTPTPEVVDQISPRQTVENTLNYLNATYSLLQSGLFTGKDSNMLIQVKAWLENQQKALSLQMARLIAADADKKEGV